MTQLAIDGGSRAFDRPFPPRRLFGAAEKQAAVALFDRAIETGVAFGYNGDEEEAYCRAFADFLGGGHCDAVNSGTSAIYVALRALDIPPFTEVIVPPITDHGGVMPVPLINCIPVVADTDGRSHNCGPEQIAARITGHTSAIIVAHIAGLPVDMDPIMDLARARDIKVIEDCAQSHGARYKGRTVGTIGDAGAFSTMSGKHHATAAQGGVVFTRDEATYGRARRASDRGKPFGLTDATGNVIASHNLNLNDLAAAVGRVQLAKLPAMIEARRGSALAIGRGLEDLAAVRLLGDPPGCRNVFWFLMLDFEPARSTVDKHAFVAALAAEGLPVSAGYVRPITESAWFRDRAVFGDSGYPWSAPEYGGDPDRPMPLPNFEATDQRLFGMQVHESLSARDVADIIAAFGKVDAAYAR